MVFLIVFFCDVENGFVDCNFLNNCNKSTIFLKRVYLFDALCIFP